MRMKHEFDMKELHCLDCPMFNFWLSFCQAMDKSLNDYMVMPDWCPLVDVSDIQCGLEHVVRDSVDPQNHLPEEK